VTRNQKDQLDVLLLRFMVMNGIPFNAIDSESFLDFVKTLRPLYNPPGEGFVSCLIHLCLLAANHEGMQALLDCVPQPWTKSLPASLSGETHCWQERRT
jgi:hypothetical protein